MTHLVIVQNLILAGRFLQLRLAYGAEHVKERRYKNRLLSLSFYRLGFAIIGPDRFCPGAVGVGGRRLTRLVHVGGDEGI